MLLTASAPTGWLNKAYQGAMSARACASVISWPEATVATASNANESATLGWSISYLQARGSGTRMSDHWPVQRQNRRSERRCAVRTRDAGLGSYISSH